MFAVSYFVAIRFIGSPSRVYAERFACWLYLSDIDDLHYVCLVGCPPRLIVSVVHFVHCGVLSLLRF